MKTLILVILLFPAICCSQQVFEKYFTFSNWSPAQQIIELPGQGYAVVGIKDSLSFDSFGAPVLDYISGFICKLDYFGDTIKKVEIGNSDTLFNSQFGKNSDDFFRNIILTQDGNIFIIGETQSYNASFLYDYDLWVLKFDFNLDLIWMKQFSLPDSALSTSISESCLTKSGGVIIPGFEIIPGVNFNMHLTEFDSLGNLLFHKRILPQFAGYLMGVSETSDNGYMSIGYIHNIINSNDLSPIVIKADSIGDVEWYNILPFSGDENLAQSITSTSDGNYVYTWANVIYHPGAANKVWMMHATKVDLSGNELWTKDYGYSFDYFQRIKELPNGNLMMSGQYTDTLGTGRQAFIMVCNSDGDSLWTRKYSGEPGPAPGVIPRCYDGTFTSDGGFILASETYCCNFTPNLGWTSSLWVLKTDSLGLITSVGDLKDEKVENILLSSPFPNPCVDVCTISTLIPPINSYSGGEQGVYLLLFDIQGRQLRKIEIGIGLNQTTIDLSGLSSGEYVVALSVNGFNRGVKKVLKQ